jgi:ABC-type phosphate transport system substrate-binding protein
VRIITRLLAVGAAAGMAATMVAVAVAPASAEPLNPKTGKAIRPAAYDIVAVGSESLAYLEDQLTWNYNKVAAKKKHSPSNPFIYSWDGVPTFNLNDTTEKIIVKQGCKKNLRPDGSSAGIKDLPAYGKTSYTTIGKNHKKTKHTVPCIDYARSSRPRGSSDPAFAKGGDAFVVLAEDAVTYAVTSNTNVPNNLSKKQLVEIFGCSVPAANGFAANTWGALLGPSAKGASQAIDPIVPQSGSGTLSFWMETALGLPTDTEPSCGTAAKLGFGAQPEENEGISKVFLLNGKPNPNVIYPYSIGVYVSQAYHSAKIGKTPTKSQNKFGKDERGVLHLDSISGLGAPIINKKTNPKWNNSPFRRFLYDVVRYTTTTSNHIPSYLNKWLGRTGYFCKQKTVLEDYGFEPTRLCGVSS